MSEDRSDLPAPLAWTLRRLGEEYGPLGVALAAASFTDPRAVIDRLQRSGDGGDLQSPMVTGAEAAAELRRAYRDLDTVLGHIRSTLDQDHASIVTDPQ